MKLETTVRVDCISGESAVALAVHKDQLAAAFDRWMQKYIDHPEAFEREWQAVVRHIEEDATGAAHTYGAACVAYLQKLLAEEEETGDAGTK